MMYVKGSEHTVRGGADPEGWSAGSACAALPVADFFLAAGLVFFAAGFLGLFGAFPFVSCGQQRLKWL